MSKRSVIRRAPKTLVTVMRGAWLGALRALRPLASRDLASLRTLKIALVVPTAGLRTATLEALFTQSGVPHERIYVIATTADVILPLSVHRIDDLGSINIHRWWNQGLAQAQLDGADVAVVANDDVIIDAATIPSLVQALLETKATLACPGGGKRTYRRGLPLRWYLDGSLWAINLYDSLRPSEEYNWWMGDRDLEVRARTEFNGITTAPVAFQHTPGTQSGVRDDLMALAWEDMHLFGERHPVVTRAMKNFQRLPRWLQKHWP